MAAYVQDGGLDGQRLLDFLSQYLATTTRVHHPGFVGHQVAVTYYSGALGSLIDGFTNNAVGVYEMGPGAMLQICQGAHIGTRIGEEDILE